MQISCFPFKCYRFRIHFAFLFAQARGRIKEGVTPVLISFRLAQDKLPPSNGEEKINARDLSQRRFLDGHYFRSLCSNTPLLHFPYSNTPSFWSCLMVSAL